MPTRDQAPSGAPCWMDLLSSDVPAAIRFYGELLGWTADEPDPEFGGYVNFRRDGEWIAGMMANDPTWGRPTAGRSTWPPPMPRRLRRPRRRGATVTAGPHPVGDLGTMLVLTDPTGASIGAWQPGTHPGFRTVDEVGTPAHFELHTPDHDAAVRFYAEVFGGEVQVESDDPEFRYTNLTHGDDPSAGIMDASGHLPDGTAPFWVVYLRVADTDVALAQIRELGGSADQPAADTPYGRLAEVADPTGARFRIVSG